MAQLTAWRAKQALEYAREVPCRRLDGSYVLGDISRKRYSAVAIPVISAPFMVLVISLLMAPGYILPFLNLFAACLSHVLGTWVFVHVRNNIPRTIIFAVFSMPLIFIPMLGPSVVTLQTVLGQVLSGH